MPTEDELARAVEILRALHVRSLAAEVIDPQELVLETDRVLEALCGAEAHGQWTLETVLGLPWKDEGYEGELN